MQLRRLLKVTFPALQLAVCAVQVWRVKTRCFLFQDHHFVIWTYTIWIENAKQWWDELLSKRQKKFNYTECDLSHEPNTPILTLPNTSESTRCDFNRVPGLATCAAGSHIKTPATHPPLSSHLLREISLCRNGVDYDDLVWHGLLEQSECQNVTNLAEPSVPRSPLPIPTSILKRHSVRGGSTVVEDMADLTTTWWFSI